MIKNVYFHIDEIGRDAITASALKKAFEERGINLVYGNRFYTQKLLEHFIFAFDIVILPRPDFLCNFKNLNKNIPPIVIIFTESVGRVVHENNDKLTLFSLLDRPFMEGDTRYVDKVTSFCLWGESAKKRIDKYYPEITNKFHVTGHPRHDKRCLKKKKNISETKKKIGLITRQPLLNDFQNRPPVESIVKRYSVLKKIYDYNNVTSGDFLLSQDNKPENEIYLEAADIKILLELISKLNKDDYEIYLKVHPRENRQLWVNFVKKYNLNVNLAHWRMPFLHWVKNLDLVIGPSSTSFYDCCVAGVQPICTRKIDEKRDPHIDEFSEENGPLMKHIETPNSIDEIIKIINKKNQKFELSKEIEQILLNETNYPESINSIDKIVDISLAAKKKDLVSPLMKNIYLIGFYLCGILIIDLRVRISRLIKRKTEQGSSFLMTKKNRKYIDSLVD